jgi:hypothetical protein
VEEGVMRVPDIGNNKSSIADEFEWITGEDVVDIGRLDVNRAIRELLAPAEVALAPGRPEPSEEDAKAILTGLIGVVERAMPEHLQGQDIRLQSAKSVPQLIRQQRG